MIRFTPDPKPAPKEKKPSQLRRTPMKKKVKVTGERKLFDEIAEERGMFCQVTGTEIRPKNEQEYISCFSHLMSKGSMPAARLDKRNVWIVHPWVHDLWNLNPEHEIFREKRKVRDLLKQEYNQVK